jgi:hypothetical protein
MILQDTNDFDFFFGIDKVFSLRENTAPISYFDPASDNHLTNKKYVDNNFLPLNGGNISGSLLVGDGSQTARLYLVSDLSSNESSEIAFTRNDGTYRFSQYGYIDDTRYDFNLYDVNGTTVTSQLSLINDGNIRILDNTQPANEYDLTTKKYVDESLVPKADSAYVETRLDEKLDIAGGTITGSLTVGDTSQGGNLTICSTPATKAAIFLKNSNNIVKGSISLEQVNEIIEVVGKTKFFDGATSSVSPTEAEDLTTKDYVDNVTAVRTFTTTENTLTRAVIDDIVGANAMTEQNKKHFRIITKYGSGNERVYLVEYIEEIDKYAVRRLYLK